MSDTKNWVKRLARPNIAAMSAYSARGPATTALHLDANESPWTPPPLGAATVDYNRYPAQQPPALRARLAAIYGVAADNIMMGRGADEAIDVLMRTFCEPGKDSILICPPTFSFFKTSATIQGAKIVEVPTNATFEPDVSAIDAAVTRHAPKLVFFCSPNNPTGNSWENAEILTLCKNHPDALFVVDEAYVEFSDKDSLAAQISTHRNLVIMRTLSKAYGLAGVRMGVSIADADITAMMLKVLPPYPVPRPVERAVSETLSPAAMALHDERLRIILSERARMMAALKKSPYIAKVYPSDANFILIKAQRETELLQALGVYNVKIRDFRAKISGHFRITIGTPEENDIALTALGVTDAASINMRASARIGEVVRTTKETDIAVRVNLDDAARVHVETGLGFFDHMLEQIAKHGGMGLNLKCEGDLVIDSHHTVEDTALALGEAMRQALGNKMGIGRYGFLMPMDETLAQVAIDLSGRPAFRFDGQFPTESVGEFASEMCPHFFQSLSQSLGASIQIDVRGDNTHHMIEACFKGVGRALRPALAQSGTDMPSTKGIL